jgi:hypothetical protein
VGDGKVKKLVTGVNFGLEAYFHFILGFSQCQFFSCTACKYSPDQFNDTEVIAAGTELGRSFSSNMEVCHMMRIGTVLTHFCPSDLE